MQNCSDKIISETGKIFYKKIELQTRKAVHL